MFLQVKRSPTLTFAIALCLALSWGLSANGHPSYHDSSETHDGPTQALANSNKPVRINLLARTPAKKRAKKKRRPRRNVNATSARSVRRTTSSKTNAEGRAPHNLSCPEDMALVEKTCVDRYEAPNRPGSLPVVMYTFYQAEAWCSDRGKRLCYDDEWIRACQGPEGWSYPYGPTHKDGVCNDGKTWLQYDRALQRHWPTEASRPTIEGLDELLAEASSTDEASASHIEWLYQADPSGYRQGCGSYEGVFDLVGNVEEWVRRRDGGRPEFTNRLMGRFWAEKFNCGMSVSNHGNGFRFYEIGFRCCKDAD